ncbi:MAG: glycosyltransferase family 2 protein [Proteobacteria bacterium]|nr:glycosyltransferase family 2 protein [Pseudomonadota bacterium]
MSRFPGKDGLVIIAAQVLLMLGLAIKPSSGLAPAVALTGLLTLIWLVGAARIRRPHIVGSVSEVKILVVIPTHGNAGTIAEVVRGCFEQHEHVLVVDDGSPDDSGDRAEAAGAIVLRHAVNRGKGAALQTALDYALAEGFSNIICVDADGQLFPEDLPAFIAGVKAHPGAIHAGVRDMSESPIGSVRARANSNFWVWVETGRWLQDTQCGYRAYPVIPVLRLALAPSRYQWEVEVLTRGIWSGIAVDEVPCRVYYPPAEERVSSYRKVVDTVRVTWVNVVLVAERILWPPRWVRRGPTSDWRGQHRGSLVGWRLFLGILRTFGRRACLAAVSPLGFFYWAVAPTLRGGLSAYFRRRSPELPAWRRSLWMIQTMVLFAWSIVDRFAALVVPGSVPLKKEGVEQLREALYQGDQGVILLTAHVGTAEVASAMLRQAGGRKVNIVMHVSEGDPYQTLLREVLGEDAPSIIAINGDEPASISILHALRRNEAVAMKIDRVVDERTALVDFLGDPIRLPTGPLVLAALSGATTVLLSAFRESDGSYSLATSEPRTYAFKSRRTRDADLAGWAQEMADVLAEWTAQHPRQWFNFHDPWSQTDASDT